MEQNRKTALVTGGAGFIGSHLCKALVEKGYNVICVDNLLTGNKRNIAPLVDNERFTFIQKNILVSDFASQLADRISDVGVTHIFHLASPASPVQYQDHPIETIQVNTQGTYTMLQLARKLPARFLFASTSEVYGNPGEHPQKESYWGNVNSFGARSCYDESKRCGEAYVYTFLTKFNVDARIVRIFNTYGPNMEKDDGRVVSNFINQAIRDKPITVYGDGSQTRSFCYVSDLVDGIIRAMETDVRGEVINLGNPDERSVKDIAQLIQHMTGSRSSIVTQDLPVDDPTRRQPDISKARTLLGWEPKVGLDEGLKKTIEYFRRAG